MDFSIPAELQSLRQSFATFLAREVRPVEDRYAPSFAVGEFTDEMREAAQSIKRRSCEEGFYAA
jgi:hypothetical protein